MFQLTESDQRSLLEIARISVQSHLAGETPRLFEISNGVLTEPYAVFVSIHKGHELRGCIGNVHPRGPLYRSTAECAIAAAVGDARFLPLTALELQAIEFEISVLSAIEPVQDIGEIEVGKHGLIISKRSLQGLLLPQVATLYGWNRETFLRETCTKAGLQPDDWREGASISRFGAIVFSDHQFHQTAAS